MISSDYNQIIERISKETGISIEEIKRRVEAKRAKLSGLISNEGAAQVVAAELGIRFDHRKVKINELLSGMRKISVEGKIIKIFPVRTFKTKNAESKVVSFLLGDETGNVRCVLWDINHIALIEKGDIHESSIVEIKNASVRGTDIKEIHLGSQGEIKESDAKITQVVTKETSISKKIAQLKANDRALVRANIVQAFEPRFFPVCPECGKKVVLEEGKFSCAQHGGIIPNERAILNLIVDDGSGNIRAVLFSESAKKLLQLEIEQFKSVDLFLAKKQELLGKEFFFSGIARLNKLFNNLELIIQDLHDAEADEIIKELSKK